MKKFIYILFTATMLASCTKKFEEINTDPTQFTKATPEALMATSVKRTGDMMAGLNQSKFWDLAHFITQVANRYDMRDAGQWQTSYVNILSNLNQIVTIYGNDTSFTNRVQIARIWQSYIYSFLVGYYGPIPMKQANNPNYLAAIQFDSEDTVYTNILANLKDAASKINLAKTQDKLTYDGVYNGDLLRWKKFANTLRLKIALRCTKNLGAVATAHIREVMADESNTINSEAETVKVAYENVNNNENPYFKTYAKAPFSGSFPKLNDYLLTFFRSYRDPRLDAYFDSVPPANRYVLTDTLTSTTDDSLRVVSYQIPYYGLPKSPTLLPAWSSALAGQTSPQAGLNINTYSNPDSSIYNSPARPFIILSYADALFCKAEAAQLGLGGTRTAEAYYNSGIDANFAFWGINNTLRDAYKAMNGIKWNTAGTGFRNYLGIVNTNIPAANINKIWIQSWLNYYPDQAFDFWVLQRRTGVLDLPPHTNPPAGSPILDAAGYSDIPARGTYPSTVSTLNPEGYASALAHLGTVEPNELTNPYLLLRFAGGPGVFKPKDWNAVPAQYDLSALRKWYGTTIQALRASGRPFTLISTFHP